MATPTSSSIFITGLAMLQNIWASFHFKFSYIFLLIQSLAQWTVYDWKFSEVKYVSAASAIKYRCNLKWQAHMYIYIILIRINNLIMLISFSKLRICYSQSRHFDGSAFDTFRMISSFIFWNWKILVAKTFPKQQQNTNVFGFFEKDSKWKISVEICIFKVKWSFLSFFLLLKLKNKLFYHSKKWSKLKSICRLFPFLSNPFISSPLYNQNALRSQSHMTSCCWIECLFFR